MSMNRCVKCNAKPILKSKNIDGHKNYYYTCPNGCNNTSLYEDTPENSGISMARQEWQTNKLLSKPNSFECRFCGERVLSDYNYCPHCGARMDGKE